MSPNARELYLFAVNDPTLDVKMSEAIRTNLTNKHRKGTYDPANAVRAWMHAATEAAKLYSRANSSGKDWARLFSVPVRREVAEQLEREFREELTGRRQNPGTRFYAAPTHATRMENPRQVPLTFAMYQALLNAVNEGMALQNQRNHDEMRINRDPLALKQYTTYVELREKLNRWLASVEPKGFGEWTGY